MRRPASRGVSFLGRAIVKDETRALLALEQGNLSKREHERIVTTTLREAEHYESFILQFRVEIYDRISEIDSWQEMDWHSLTVGWAIARGMKGDEAYDFATFIRYKTIMG
jgi:hypothetical protein